MCKYHHQLNLRLLDSFLKEGGDWGQFFTISAIQELVTQAAPQPPNFSIWSFVYPLESFIHVLNKRLFLHNFAFKVLQEHWWSVSGPLPAQDWGVLLSAWIFVCRTPSVVAFLRAGEEPHVHTPCLCCLQGVKGVSSAAFPLMCPCWAAAAEVLFSLMTP